MIVVYLVDKRIQFCIWSIQFQVCANAISHLQFLCYPQKQLHRQEFEMNLKKIRRFFKMSSFHVRPLASGLPSEFIEFFAYHRPGQVDFRRVYVKLFQVKISLAWFLNRYSPSTYICLDNLISRYTVPSQQFRSVWKWYGWIGLDMYGPRLVNRFYKSSLLFKVKF